MQIQSIMELDKQRKIQEGILIEFLFLFRKGVHRLIYIPIIYYLIFLVELKVSLSMI